MKQIMRPTLAAVAVAVAAALAFAGVSRAQTKQTATPAVNKAQASEIVGYELAGRYPEWARDLVDPRQVGAAVTRALEGQKPSMSETQAQSVAKAFGEEFAARAKQEFAKVSAANKQAGEAYLAKN